MCPQRRDGRFFYNANNFRNKDLREWNPQRNDEQDVVITSSGIPYSIKSFFLNLLASKKVLNIDVVGILVTSESRRSIKVGT